MSDQPKLNFIDNFFMIATALVFDGIPAFFTFVTLPLGGIGGVVAGYIVWPFAWLTCWLWFTMKGVKFLGNKWRTISFFGMPVLEFIPYLNNLPGWTAMVVVTSMTVKAEEKLTKLVPRVKPHQSKQSTK